MNRPLISCVMPTRGRPEFARAAVAGFLAQTYPAKELVIADDPTNPSLSAEGWDGEQIRYLVAPDGLTLGAKRNWVNAQARGPVIAHWDDDDWYAAHRLAEQFAFLLHSGADLIGYREVTFWPDTGPAWVYRGRPNYVIGCSMMYWKSAWERKPFPKVAIGSDTHWQNATPKLSTATLPASVPVIARNHPGNLNERTNEALSGRSNWERVS